MNSGNVDSPSRLRRMVWGVGNYLTEKMSRRGSEANGAPQKPSAPNSPAITAVKANRQQMDSSSIPKSPAEADFKLTAYEKTLLVRTWKDD